MIRKKNKKKIPQYFSYFIIFAMIPQIIGFNGSTVDTLFKFLLIGVLVFLVLNREHITIVSKYFFFFLLISFMRMLGTIIWNRAEILSEIQSWIIEALLLYVLYECVLYAKNIKSQEVLTFYKIFAYFMTVAAVYNIIAHFNSLLHITSLTVYNTDGICSFFDNKNTYGVFLIFGTLAAIILKIVLQQQRWVVMAVLFVVNELMAMCRTALILSMILIIASFLIDKKTRFQGIIALILLVGIIIVFVRQNESVDYFLTNTLFGNSSSLDARNDYVTSMLPLVKGGHFWVGYGNSNAINLAMKYTGNAYYHNTYLKCLISGGIVKLVLQISAIMLSIKYGFKNRSYNKTIGNLCLLSTFIYVVYAFVESVILFDTPVVAIMVVMFIISMPILFYNALIYEKSSN